MKDEWGFDGVEGDEDQGFTERMEGAGFEGFEGKGDNLNLTEHATGGLRPPQTPPTLNSSQLACQHKKGKEATRKRSWWL